MDKLIPIDLLIFDLDGTLVDSLDDIVQSVNHTLAQLGFRPLQKQEIRGFVGDGIENLLIRSVESQAEASTAVIRQAAEIYTGHQDAHCLDHAKLYPHVRQTLEHFGPKKKAVISNKPEYFSKKILTALDAAEFFDVILGGDSLKERKPDPEPVRHILKLLSVENRRAVIVGDGRQDIACGKAAGISTCGVTYGFRSKEEISDADFVIDNLFELSKIYC